MSGQTTFSKGLDTGQVFSAISDSEPGASQQCPNRFLSVVLKRGNKKQNSFLSQLLPSSSSRQLLVGGFTRRSVPNFTITGQNVPITILIKIMNEKMMIKDNLCTFGSA